MACEFRERFEGGAGGRRVGFIGAGEERGLGAGAGAEDVGCIVAAASGYYGGVEGMLGYYEDGVGVLIKVGNGVVLELNFLLGRYVVGFFVGVGVHWVVRVILYLFCCFGGVEQGRVIFIESVFVGRL